MMRTTGYFGRSRQAVCAVVALLGLGFGAADAQAQPAASGPSNALQGFSQNRDKPIQIDAARLEVRDKDKVATFFGDAKAAVKVIQGDTTLRSKTLVVHYDQDNTKGGAKGNAKGGASAKAAIPGPGGSSQIRRLVANGGVVVTQKDQTVTGERGVFDMKSNTITMSGGVVLTQGDNVLRGERLVVDMSTGVSRVEGGRVQGMFKSGGSGGGGQPSQSGKGGKPLNLNIVPGSGR